MIPLTFGMKRQPYQLPGVTIDYVSAPPSWQAWQEHYLPADTQPKAPDGVVQVMSPDQLVVGRRYRRYYKPAGKNPQTTPTDQWALDTRKFRFLGQNIGFQADDSPILYTSLFDAGVEPHHGKTGPMWNWCFLVEDPTDTKAMVKEHKMEQYRFSHEELWTLLDPAIQLLKEADEYRYPDHAIEDTRDLVNNDLYSRACGEFASAHNWYSERNPVKDVTLYRHPGLATLVQLKLLGCAWKTLRAILWQQTQPKTDLYLDRFLMVARYLYDNPDLLVKVAAQYPGVWTNLVDHLEPRDVDYQWKRYAALRDIGLAQRETSKPKKSSHDLKLTTNRYVKPGTYGTQITPKASTDHAEKIKKQAQNLAANWCFTPNDEANAVAELLSAWPDYNQPDCAVQFIPKNKVFSPCPVCQHANQYCVTVRKPPVKRTPGSNWCWSAEIECCCGWETRVHFSDHESVAFSETNAVGYLAYLVNRCKEYTGVRNKKTVRQPREPKGYSFSGVDEYYAPALQVPPAADKYWSCTVPFEVSDKAAEAIKDGTHPLVPSPGQHFISLGHPVQYEQKGRITVYAQELTPAEEQALEKQYGPFVKTPYTGSIKYSDTGPNTVQFSVKKNKSVAPAGSAVKALGREILARDSAEHAAEPGCNGGLKNVDLSRNPCREIYVNPIDTIAEQQRILDAKQEELARTGSVTFDSDKGESVPPWFFSQPKPSPQNEIEHLKHRAFMCGIDTTDSTEPGYIGELRAKLLAYLQGQGILDHGPNKGGKK